MKSLVIGMGIGNLYEDVLTGLGHSLVTVDTDPNKQADFTNLSDALTEKYDTVHICTPNFTHEDLARQVADHAGIVFIEKPGVINEQAWTRLLRDYPNTRFMMVKNNQFRANIDELKDLAKRSKYVELHWINNNRVPNPGTWFTTKKLAYGGVSRDLMTHLLSLFQELDHYTFWPSVITKQAVQKHSLKDVSDTDYGQVNPNGTYDVDDYCEFVLFSGDKEWHLVADWRGLDGDDIGINFHMLDGSVERFDLGLCPADAYQTMIREALANINNDNWWAQQLMKDSWIHRMVEEF